MSSINSIGGPNPINRVISNPIHKSIPAPAPSASSGSDTVELGNIRQLLTQLKANDIRVDKVAQIKAQIADGTYETDDKLTAAADKLLDEVL